MAIDRSTTWTIDQNTTVRSVAMSFHRTYMDCMTPAVSFDWMASHGFMADSMHLNYQGSSFLAGHMWDDLGFFSLRVPRNLAIQSLGSQFRLSFGTAPKIRYTLESSEDLIQWQPLFGTVGDGTTINTNLPSNDPARWFHLMLSPIP